jgi:hypothetical protein
VPASTDNYIVYVFEAQYKHYLVSVVAAAAAAACLMTHAAAAAAD